MGILQDFRFAFRALMRTPGLMLIAIVSLGLGIGAVTTVYTWTDRFVISPLPGVQQTSRLSYMNTGGPGGSFSSISYPVLRDWNERNRVFDGIAAFSVEQAGVRIDGPPERVFVLATTANYFDVLGVRPIMGRAFRPEDETRAAPVVVLGFGYWDRRLERDPEIVGKTLTLGGVGFTVIGVAPPKFGGSIVGLNMDLYVPVTSARSFSDKHDLTDRGNQFMEALGRLKPGVSFLAAQADMDRVERELTQLYPHEWSGARVRRVIDQGAPATMLPIFLAMLGVTALVLLIACANVANLMLARATARQKEIALRLAIGATRARVARQLLTESALLGGGGGLLGLLFAYWGRNVLMLLVPPTQFPIGMDSSLNPRVVAVASLITLLAVLVFGLMPALKGTRPDLMPVLKGVQFSGGRRQWVRQALVSGQLALSLVALTCAGLFIRAMQRAQSIDPGFQDPAHLLLVSSDLQIAGINDSTGPMVVDGLLARLRQLPGVEAAAVGRYVPLGFGGYSSQNVEVDGYLPAKDEDASVQYSVVSGQYFETMGIPMVQGRSIQDGDRPGSAPAMVVNEAFIRRFFAGRDPIGRQVTQEGRRWTIVGVARDGKYASITDPSYPLIYRPLAQSVRPDFTVHIRTAGNPKALIEPVRREFASVNANLPFLDPRSMEEQMVPSTIGQRVGSRTLAVFGALALFLAGIGLYGVMSYAVIRRRREIGIRVAVGANVATVTRMILGQGLRVAAIGIAAGAVLALLAGQALRALLLGVSPSDPLTFAVLGLILGTVAVVASLIPARRAARVDPVEVLKSE
ncbi:MAG: ABC transporter permease [Gemmatimonadota bacterium]